MIKIENDYETATYEQFFHSHIYENHLELLLDYHTRPRSSNIPIEQIVNEKTTLHKPNLKKNKYHVLVQITFTKLYQKNHKKKKFGQSPFF